MLGVTGIGDSLARARERAYAACSSIHWAGMHRRGDIALEDAANAESETAESETAESETEVMSR